MKNLSIFRIGLVTTAIVATAALPSLAQPGRLVAASNQAINIRYQPSTQSEPVTYAYSGDRVEVLSSQINPEDGFGWYRVEFPNRARGWVRADLLRLGSVPSGSGSDLDVGYTVSLNANGGRQISVRRNPSLEAAVIFSGRQGDRVRVDQSFNGQDGVWLYVVYPNALPGVASSGWVRREMTR
jgi:Bacterial SH3 domain/GW (Gly-Tryp) dipeptide domain